MQRMIFLNIGWMRNYQGISGDKIVGGGSFVKERGYGHEMFNYLPHDSQLYGYVQPRGSINLARLGGRPDQRYVDDVLAVWVSKAPTGGVYVIGWYNDARVYAEAQFLPRNSNRTYNGEDFGYYISARVADCVLLPPDERVIRVPRRTKGGMGQSNVWYADEDASLNFKQQVLDFIRTRKAPKNPRLRKTSGRPWQPDPLKRQRVEAAAITRTVKYFESLGYDVDSVEKDNVGWDLEATMDTRLLKLEVKGLSQDIVSIELTPNEYKNMLSNKDSYRICVLTNALSDHQVFHVFSFSPDSTEWENENGGRLKITEVTSARMTL